MQYAHTHIRLNTSIVKFSNIYDIVLFASQFNENSYNERNSTKFETNIHK